MNVKRVLYLVTFLALMGCTDRQQDSTPATADSTQWTETVAQWQQLEAAEYHIHKLVTQSDPDIFRSSLFGHRWSRRFSVGDRKVAVPIDVTMKVVFDFSSFGAENVRLQGQRLFVTLPDPRLVVTYFHMDERGVQQTVSWMRSDFSQRELQELALRGAESIVASAPERGLLASARSTATSLLLPLLVGQGYRERDISVQYRKPFTTDDIPSLYDEEASVFSQSQP
ncbi:MAG: DUF4230 domain-containing protein [Bacteroidaceae bacterium]|nr:DUF4230 domain-containing protein [Bacteroidaceae bacterium]